MLMTRMTIGEVKREREGEGVFGKKGRPYLNVFFEANELRNVRTGGMTAEADRRPTA